MRKTLLVIVVLLFAAPVFAGTVTMSVTDVGDGWAAISYSADANVSGFGLKISADSGAVITDIKDYNVGESVTGNIGYGIFPGTIDINATTGLVDGNGTPVAPNDDPGASGTGLNTSAIVVEMGALYVDGNEPDLSGTLIKVKIDKDCNVCVDGEPVRGDVVLTDANTAITNMQVCAAILAEVTDCLVVGQTVGGVFITQAMYDLWVSLGKPNCWCYDCHHKSDTDNDCDVDYTDAMVFIAGYSTYANGFCADTDNDGDVDYTDAMKFIDGYSNGCGTCTPGPP